MSRWAQMFTASLVLAILVGVFGDGDWWVMGLAGWAVADIVFTFWPKPSALPGEHAGAEL